MSRLTHERVNGIKTGYWSPAKKEELVQRLGQIEAKSEELIGQICDRCCKHINDPQLSKAQLEKIDAEICETCPANYLAKLIDGYYPGLF